MTTEPVRTKINVTAVGNPETIQGDKGPWQKLPVTAGTTIFFASDKRLFPLIKIGEIDADVVTTVHNEFTNRKIVQVYQNGQPIIEQKKGQWPRGDIYNPERQKSIEKQCALHCAVDYFKAEDTALAPETVLIVAEKFFAWLQGKPIPAAEQPQQPKAPIPGSPFPSATAGSLVPKETKPETTPAKVLGFSAWCDAHNISEADVIATGSTWQDAVATPESRRDTANKLQKMFPEKF